MIKARIIKVKSIENEERIVAIKMIRIIITALIITITITIIMKMRIQIDYRMKILKCWNRIKSVQIIAIPICWKAKNVQKAMLF